MNPEIRKITKQDVVEVQQIAKKVIRKNYKSFISREAIERFIGSGESDNEFTKHFENCKVISENNKIKGLAIFFDNFIHLMMVDTEAQRSGYGTKLLNYVTQIMKENNYTTAKLETFKENIQAVNFYLKNGWVIKSEKNEEDLGLNRVFLEKRI